MDKKEIAPGIIVYSNVYDNIDELPSDIEIGMMATGLTWSSAGVDGGNNKNIRDTDSVSIPYIGQVDEDFNNTLDAFNKNVANIFFEILNPIEKDYMNSYGVYFETHDNYEILKYGLGQKFTNHIDDHPHYHRRISMVFYLNENYEGGEIVFPRFNLTYKPKSNEVILFPSTYVYNHSVLPVISGTRYCVVSWIK